MSAPENDALLEAYDFPDAFSLATAENMAAVEAADGTRFRVLVSARDGSRELVHADVVDYDGPLAHPATTGLFGFLAVLGALLVPIFATYYAAVAAGSALATIGITVVGMILAIAASNVVLGRTVAGDWVWRFMEWNEHKYLIKVCRQSTRGETADRGGAADQAQGRPQGQGEHR